jgi:uncharacterized protein YndB with AHSA1/START domain
MASRTGDISFSYPLRARRDRVWDTISDAGQFGFWFGAEFNGQFAVGTPLPGRIIPTRSHAGIGRAQQPYLGATFEISIERVEPMSSFAFSWRPLTTASGDSCPAEPATLVALELEETTGGTNLTITESGPAISSGLWPPREMALLIEKFLDGAIDLRPSGSLRWGCVHG